jgi:hypothetical protein
VCCLHDPKEFERYSDDIRRGKEHGNEKFLATLEKEIDLSIQPATKKARDALGNRLDALLKSERRSTADFTNIFCHVLSNNLTELDSIALSLLDCNEFGTLSFYERASLLERVFGEDCKARNQDIEKYLMQKTPKALMSVIRLWMDLRSGHIKIPESARALGKSPCPWVQAITYVVRPEWFDDGRRQRLIDTLAHYKQLSSDSLNMNVAMLDSNLYRERREAALQLEAKGEAALGALESILKDATLSVEQRAAIERICESIKRAPLDPIDQEVLRFMEVEARLNPSNSGRAIEVLRGVSRNYAETRVACEAKSALLRLEKGEIRKTK